MYDSINDFQEKRNTKKSEFTGVNMMGRLFLNGKPLAEESRKEIVQLYLMGRSPTAISRELKVSHGCVSKIIERYLTTGTILPCKTGGSRPRIATEAVVHAIMEYKKKNSSIFGWEIRKNLVNDGVCSQSNLPSVSSINRIVRTYFGKKYSKTEHDEKEQIITSSNSNSDEEQFNYGRLTESQRDVYNMMLRGNLFKSSREI